MDKLHRTIERRTMTKEKESTSVAIVKETNVSVPSVFDASLITPEAIKQQLCPQANDTELALAINICRTQNLNPFAGDVHLVKYKTDAKLQIILSKYAFLKRAERHPDYIMFQAGTKKEDNDFIGWAKVWRKSKPQPYEIEIHLSEYKQDNVMWKTKPHTMLRKVAITQCLREAFPDELGGLYCEDEMPAIPKNQYNPYSQPDNDNIVIEVKHEQPEVVEEAEEKTSKITLQQTKRLFAILYKEAEANNKTKEDAVNIFKSHIFHMYGLESSKDITTDIYNDIISSIPKLFLEEKLPF